MTDIITNWLGFAVDCLGPREGWAVFPQGEKVLQRQQDILGGQRLRKRLTFLIRCNCASPTAMESFAQWAQQTAPQLGQMQTLRLEDAHLAAKHKDGPGRYEAKLIFEFTV